MFIGLSKNDSGSHCRDTEMVKDEFEVPDLIQVDMLQHCLSA